MMRISLSEPIPLTPPGPRAFRADGSGLAGTLVLDFTVSADEVVTMITPGWRPVTENGAIIAWDRLWTQP